MSAFDPKRTSDRVAKKIRHVGDDSRLLVRAGVGWHEGIVGRATVGADLESPSGFAFAHWQAAPAW